MTTGVSDVLTLAVRLVTVDNEEESWREFRFKLENYRILVSEGHVALVLDARSQTTTITWDHWSSVKIRTHRHTL